MRDLGLSLPEINNILARPADAASALEQHRAHLRDEQRRIGRQIVAVESTISALKEGKDIMPESMFDGFDHTAYKDEVENRWGADAYATGDAWWRGKTATEKEQWRRDLAALSADWTDAAARGIPVTSDEAQALAARHLAWLLSVPGTPAGTSDDATRAYVLGLGDLYASDPRFAANYGGQVGAEFVRDALRAHLGSD